MRLTLVRNATLLLDMQGQRILVDPMLDDVGARPPVENTPNARRNPLVPLPIPAAELVEDLDAVLVTHLHKDHFDETAAKLLPRDVVVFCQPEDMKALGALGLQVLPIAEKADWKGPTITRTGGRHGSGAIAELLAPVSGFVIDDLYIAGDTVWCPEVDEAIAAHQPRVAVVNGSGARFLEGDPIVMTIEDIRRVADRVPRVVVVHLEAINHCIDTRDEVRSALPHVIVPEDGETLAL